MAGAIVLDHFVGLTTLLVLSSGLLLAFRPLGFAIDKGVLVLVVVAAMVAAGVMVVRSQLETLQVE